MGELQCPRDHSLRSSKKISISAQSLELNLSCTAALCCLFRKLQLERRHSPVLFSFSQSVKHFGPPTLFSKRSSLHREGLFLNLQALQNHHNKTLARVINTHTDINGRLPTDVFLWVGYVRPEQNVKRRFVRAACMPLS